MFCFRCGAEVEEGSVFCDKCGALMDDGPTQARNEAGRIDFDGKNNTPSPNVLTAKDESLNERRSESPGGKAWAAPSSVLPHEKIEEPSTTAPENDSESKHVSYYEFAENNQDTVDTNFSTHSENDSSKSEVAPSPESTKDRSKATLIIIVAIVIAILVAVGIFAFGTLSSSNNRSSTKVYESNETVDMGSAASNDVEEGLEDERVEDAPPFVGFKSVSATSELPTGGINSSSYVAANLIDGSSLSCWCEGASGNGVGEFVAFKSPVRQTIKGFAIWNGYQESDYLYDINARPKTITVYADDGFIGSFNLADSGLGSQNIAFDDPVIAKTITIEIEAVYAGSKYDDCCISEIDFY